LPLPHEPGPHWGEVGIHGLHRQREWDLVVTVDAPEAPGDEQWLVVLADGQVVVEEGGGGIAGLVSGIALEPPFRAHAVRRDGSLWAIAARRIETVELLRDPGGDAIELVWNGTERSVRVDGEPTLAGVPDLERLGAGRSPTYVVTASRLTGSTWEVTVTPL
jgi:hypothetical protein